MKEGKKGKTRKWQNHIEYAAMVKTLDDNIGRVNEFLEQENLKEHTIIVFTSDNGGFSTYNKTVYSFYKPPTNNDPYRAGKAYPYEGGIRVPMFILWKNHITPTVVEESPVISSDLFPTLLELTGLSKTIKLNVDGQSFVSELMEEEKSDQRPFFWHFPHYHIHAVPPFSAVRSGDYKLIYWYESAKYELYNVVEDISEAQDLASSDPEKLEELRKLMNEFIAEMDADVPLKKHK